MRRLLTRDSRELISYWCGMLKDGMPVVGSNLITADAKLCERISLELKQYLLALRESKNIVSSRRATLKQPLEGDVVLMVDPSLRRGFWRTAIIDKLIRSGDGQKPRRNDGSTMSTTSPSSGCFSVALLLPTIFLDSLRASKYCSVQIVQSSCRYPGLNWNTHTNEPPIPGTQFDTHTNEPPIRGT
ncbi:hypothetical protein V9T40_000322 [Parthenolecanium corni]|uniref:DUF5641 domain-containing protein n=1 Tax=Parthenolecanium corni TaxID=536013 RepID=A0AAN9TD42_9HEMI